MKNHSGFSLIELLIVVTVLAIVAVIAAPNILASRRAANEGSAISSLRTIAGAQHTYMTSVGAGEYGTINDLVNSSTLDQTFTGGGPKSGFNFVMNVILRSSTTYAAYDCNANPVTATGPMATSSRRYYINETGTIYQAPAAGTITGNPATRVVTGGTPLDN